MIRRAAALTAVGALALAGCSDDTVGTPAETSTTVTDAAETLEAVEPPADSTELTAGGLALSVPAGWETAQDDSGGLSQATARGELEGGRRAAVNLVGVPTAETDVATSLEEARSLGEVAEETEVVLPQVPGGTATLLDLEVDIEGEAARTWVLVLEHEGQTYTVTYLAVPFDETLARQTLGTLRDA